MTLTVANGAITHATERCVHATVAVGELRFWITAST